MMVAVFASLSLALLVCWFGSRFFAVLCILVCFVLTTSNFLLVIYNPEYGFRMPWIQTQYIDNPLTADKPLVFHHVPQMAGDWA
ncbi:hypothetical protein [Chelativorans sp. J32]|uniref:hypothetical protein n=1 Tax=Chelativorans sp. J32 TaxID=935840 RepID=UPI0004BC0B72|nr:hypothetical protein [Chelativorans sp. J32]